MTCQLISVVMSVWNGGDYLKDAIESILGQSYAPIELIVVDDGSTDHSNAVLKEYGNSLKLITQKNRGQSAGLHAGITCATGHYLAFLDADDLWTIDKLKRQCDILEHEGLEAVFCLSEQFISPELVDIQNRNNLSTTITGEAAGCMLIDRAAFDRIGDFDLYSKTAFIDWLGRAKDLALRYKVLQEVLHRRRIHKANFSKVFPEARNASLLAALRKKIVRSRSCDGDKTN